MAHDAMRPPRPLAAAFCAHAARSGSRVAAADACRDSARRPPACAVTQQVTSCACRRAVLSRGGAPAARRAWAGQGGQGGVKRSGSPRGVFEHLPHHHGRVEQHGAPRPGQIPDHLVVDGKRQIELSEAGERAAQRHDRAGRVWSKVVFAAPLRVTYLPPTIGRTAGGAGRSLRGGAGALRPARCVCSASFAV